MELKVCPFCGGPAKFHGGGQECDGCHYIECQRCKVLVDFGTSADPNNDDITLEQLRERIAPFWNRRAGEIGICAGCGQSIELHTSGMNKHGVRGLVCPTVSASSEQK